MLSWEGFASTCGVNGVQSRGSRKQWTARCTKDQARNVWAWVIRLARAENGRMAQGPFHYPSNQSCLCSQQLYVSVQRFQKALDIGFPLQPRQPIQGLAFRRYPIGEGNGNPLQYSCLANPMDGGAWWAAVHGVARSWTRLSDFTFTFHFHALEKAMATHSSVFAWRIPGTGEPGGLLSLGLHRVRHN